MAKQADPFKRLRDELRRQRRELGVSVVDVARASHVGASKIRGIEQGELESPRLIHVARLAAYYGMDGGAVFDLVDLQEDVAPAYRSAADGYDAGEVPPG